MVESWVDRRRRLVAACGAVALCLLLAGGCQEEKKTTPTTDDQPAGCKCKHIDIRLNGPVLGPKGDGSAGWPVGAGTAYEGVTDGKTLGPLKDNPGAKKGIGARNQDVGFGFEIECTVNGVPGECKEMQLVKATSVNAAGPPKHKAWTGTTADLDQDGVTDVDVTTADKCKGLSGTWNGTDCTLTFPQAGAKYGPDVAKAGDPGGAYEKPFDYKVHLGGTSPRIIWFDVPFMPRGGRSKKADLIAFVRGTDKKYCYVTFTLDLAPGQGGAADKESLTKTGGADGADRLPGVP